MVFSDSILQNLFGKVYKVEWDLYRLACEAGLLDRLVSWTAVYFTKYRH